jgi:hypothetical protein
MTTETLSASAGHLVYSDAPQHAPVVYREQLPVEAQLAKLHALHKKDKATEKRVTVLGWSAVGCIIAGVASFILAGMTGFDALLYGIALVPLIVPLMIFRAILKRSDIDDRKLHAARRLLEVLGGDLKPGTPVALKIDFGGYDRSKPVAKAGGFFSTVKEYQFVKRDWLDLRFTLADGTRVKLTASTHAKRKTKAKRKYTKVKDKISERLNLIFTAPKGRTLNPAMGHALRQRLHRGQMRITTCKVKPRAAMIGFSFGVASRYRGRAGWSSHGLSSLIDGDDTLFAVVRSYKATALLQKAA